MIHPTNRVYYDTLLVGLIAGRHLKVRHVVTRRMYQHAADTWVTGRHCRAHQVRANKVKGITIAYGKRLPIGGIQGHKGYYPYHRRAKVHPRLINKHDRDVAKAINQVPQP